MRPLLDWDALYRTGRHLTSWELDTAAPELVAFLEAHPPAEGGAAAVDLGCGSGRDALLLAERGYRAWGVDISPEALALALARRHGANQKTQVTWIQADAAHLPFPAGAFDLVTDRGCLHHLGGPERTAYAREVARILKPGGLLFIRGCRSARFPFVPLVAEELPVYFPPALFEIASAANLELVTNGGTIPGSRVELRRK